MDTKWNETLKTMNKKENFMNNTNNDVLKMENKLKKINQRKKSLTKLPLLENIYESNTIIGAT